MFSTCTRGIDTSLKRFFLLSAVSSLHRRRISQRPGMAQRVARRSGMCPWAEKIRRLIFDVLAQYMTHDPDMISRSQRLFEFLSILVGGNQDGSFRLCPSPVTTAAKPFFSTSSDPYLSLKLRFGHFDTVRVVILICTAICCASRVQAKRGRP